jgi:hypothetical protein
MNPLNYATLEASRRLHAKGIVLETEAWWILGFDGKYSLVCCATEVMMKVVKDRVGSIPAPSMTEIWRELPLVHPVGDRRHWINMDRCEDGRTRVLYAHLMDSQRQDTNPTDALIDLLIWVKEQRKEEGK